MKREYLYDSCQLFDILQLELLPGEVDDDSGDIQVKAVEEYYNWFFEFDASAFFDKPGYPEIVEGCNALRRLLTDLGDADFTTVDKVWKVMATVDENLELLKLAVPLLKHMWN